MDKNPFWIWTEQTRYKRSVRRDLRIKFEIFRVRISYPYKEYRQTLFTLGQNSSPSALNGTSTFRSEKI